MGVATSPVVLLADRHVGERAELGDALQERYRTRFTVRAVGGRADAREVLRVAERVGQPVAAAIAELALDDGTGLALLEEIKQRHPGAKLMLLTGRRDAEAAIDAINRVQLDRYLTKPVDPLEQRLYPMLDDLLGDWEARYGPRRELRIIGHRYTPRSYEIKDFLSRNLVAFRWLNIDDPCGEAMALAEELGLPPDYPTTAVLEDGTVLPDPSRTELAEVLGLAAPIARHHYRLAVIGGGPAGLAAGVYGACEGWRTIVIESDAPGGQAGSTSRIENYLGFPSGLSGNDLAHRALDQAERLGVDWAETRTAVNLRPLGRYHLITLEDDTRIACDAVIIATGMQWRHLPLDGIAPLVNRGIYYGACLSEAPSTAGEDVYMVGAGNSAAQAALFFAQSSASVHLLVRERALRDAPISSYLADRIEGCPNLVVHPHTEVAAVHGTEHLTGLDLRDNITGTDTRVSTNSLYILIGAVPNTGWVADSIALDERGFIRTGTEVKDTAWPLTRDPMLTETSLPGVFAAGDVRAGSAKRIGSAVGEGAITVQAVAEYLRNLGVHDPLTHAH
ncbi:FAD-dependent oxidoreductase [Nocardia terpenica]|uniref:FAD-dependent oxidoreductase n=1 Tax=Nocardia terpenica TaxID=455432 RepID=UPI001932F67F|nr:FAD-dependent oxidoreductase [Nocardia terpenica]